MSDLYPPPADLRLIWDPLNARADLAMFKGGPLLETGNDLQTAIIISLFTDQTADPGDVIPPDMAVDPRGWWADTYEGDRIGSKLWQVIGRITDQDTLNFAGDTAAKSLQWLIDDGVAGAVAVNPSFYSKGGLRLDIAVTSPAGGAPALFSFVWAAQGVRPAIVAPVPFVGPAGAFTLEDNSGRILLESGAGYLVQESG
jgi:phage gp46-like protein